MLALNALPVCHLTAVALGTGLVHGAMLKMAVALGGIYLLPPLAVRVLGAIHPLRPGIYTLDAPEFLWWWASAQGQILFCRFPFFEEALRLVPAAYSAWLRIWGSRIGRFTY